MEPRQLLRYVALGLIFVGLMGLATSFAPAAPIFPLTGDTAFFVGLGFFSVGVVILLDLGRRARAEAMQSERESS